MKKHFLFKCCMVAGSLLLSKGAEAGIRYVKVDGAGDGSSWAAAEGSIQNAINVSSSGDMVFVAAGVYELSAAITLKDGVQLYGGFEGTESSAEQREREDKDGNGIAEPWEYASVTTLQGNGSARILTQEVAFSTPTIVDGFEIMGGKSDNGGGVSLMSGVSLQASVVSANTASANGGGVYLSGATMQGCLVAANSYGANGGGVYATAQSVIHGCKIKNNKVSTGGVSVGDLLAGGVVYSIDKAANTAQVVSLAAGSAAWSGAAAWATAQGAEWQLPTSIQLQQMYVVKALLNNTLSSMSSAQVLGNTSYWSANEADDKAGVVMFDNGYAGNLSKEMQVGVRATRTVNL
jgi:hypothetical protein